LHSASGIGRAAEDVPDQAGDFENGIEASGENYDQDRELDNVEGDLARKWESGV
jgi:hypothetical protein